MVLLDGLVNQPDVRLCDSLFSLLELGLGDLSKVFEDI
jgi:hypothetical protein